MAESQQTLICDTCKEDNKCVDALVLCRECRDLFCCECMSMHRAIRSTKDHHLIQVADINSETKVDPVIPFCDVCETTGKGQKSAECLCNDCRDLYCQPCRQHHMKLRATKNHLLFDIFQPTVITGGCTVEQSISDNSIQVSSDFEGFASQEDGNAVCAQFAVSTIKSSSNENERSDNQPKAAVQMVLSKDDIEKISVKIVSTFNAATVTDGEKCHFKGIVCLSDGLTIIGDRYNSKLKLVDGNGGIIDEAQVTGTLSGLTKISDNTFAIVHTQNVTFYTVDNRRFREQRHFKLQDRGLGICYNGSSLVVIHRDCISVISMDGVLLRRISEKPANLSWFVCADPETRDIYFTSVETNILLCLSESGDHKWSTYISLPRAVCSYGNCFLTITARGEIILCTKDGAFQKSIFKDDKELDCAEYIIHDPETQQLFVIRKSNSFVTVLKISK